MILKPTNIEYHIDDHFPTLSWGKAGVAISGGLESTLIAKIALDKYGPKNVVLVYSDDMFTVSNPESNKNVKINVDNASEILGHPVHYIPVDIELHKKDIQTWSYQIFEYMKNTHNIEFTMWGFTKLFFNVAEFKEDKNSTHESIVQKCYSNYEKYRDVIEEFHVPTGTFTEYIKDLEISGVVYPMLRSDFNRKVTLRPFDTLNKSEVLDLYIQLGYLDLAYQTISCVTNSVRENYIHCGTCFNCQQRYDAFAKLGIEDKTVYRNDTVRFAWEELQKKLNNPQS
jgi:7-cyano-7-deazaguanine synthase in queuosine biosynthesis